MERFEKGFPRRKPELENIQIEDFRLHWGQERSPLYKKYFLFIYLTDGKENHTAPADKKTKMGSRVKIVSSLPVITEATIWTPKQYTRWGIFSNLKWNFASNPKCGSLRPQNTTAATSKAG